MRPPSEGASSVPADPLERPLHVLLSAYACKPGRGSEPGNGWSTVRCLAPYHRLTVLTQERHRPAIEREVARLGGALAGVRFEYLNLPVPLRWAVEVAPARHNLRYLVWQRRLPAVVRRMHAERRFDVAHHVTFVRYWMAPGVAAVPDLPWVFGPVGGADVGPPALAATLTTLGRLQEAARDRVRRAFERLPEVRRAIRSADVAFATTPATATALERLGARDVRLALDVHAWRGDVASEPSPDATCRAERDPPLVVGVGRLIEWKAYHLAIEAWARAAVPGTLELFGEGPSRSRLVALARRLGVADRVVFHGKADRSQVLDRLRKATAFVHPALHESGSWAVLEALQEGVPVVCWHHAGPGLRVDDRRGVAVPVDGGTADTAIGAMARAIASLVEDPDLRDRLARGALSVTREHDTWELHAVRLTQAYRDAVAAHSGEAP